VKRTKFAYRPRLESLEHRWVPATVNVIGGNLYISEQVGTLNVSNLVGGQVRVQDSAKDITVSGVGGTSRSASLHYGHRQERHHQLCRQR
jgi:hypothetical protein